MEGYQQLFALTKNPKYVKMRLPKNGRSSELNNTANAGRIVRGRNGRKILPAFFAYYFVAALATAAIPQEKQASREKYAASRLSACGSLSVLRRYAGNGSPCQQVKCVHLNITTITRSFLI